MQDSYIWKSLRARHQFSATPMDRVPSLGRLFFSGLGLHIGSKHAAGTYRGQSMSEGRGWDAFSFNLAAVAYC